MLFYKGRKWGPDRSWTTQPVYLPGSLAAESLLSLRHFCLWIMEINWVSIEKSVFLHKMALFFPPLFFHSLSSHFSAKIFQVQPRCFSAQTILGKSHTHLQGRWHAATWVSILWPQDVWLWLHRRYRGHFSKCGFQGKRGEGTRNKPPCGDLISHSLVSISGLKYCNELILRTHIIFVHQK